VAIDNDDIGGVVTGANGPEAGVWVIAETRDLAVRYIKIVVTDDQGRYVLPDLPKANYDVWVRGYGLVDSPKVKSEPGKQLNLTAVPAPDEKAAAQYYPAIYWFSMLEIPTQDKFGPGNKEGIPESAGDWLNLMKNNGCVGCHQLGRLSTARSRPGWVVRDPRGVGAPHAIRTGRRTHGEHLAGQLAGAPIKYLRTGPSGSPGRAAAYQADAAAGRRAQHRRHAARLATANNICTISRQRPAQSDRQYL
jgi:hypothetical protein